MAKFEGLDPSSRQPKKPQKTQKPPKKQPRDEDLYVEKRYLRPKPAPVKVDVFKPVPSTGEPFFRWFGRRFETVAREMAGRLSNEDLMLLAGSKVADQHLSPLGKAMKSVIDGKAAKRAKTTAAYIGEAAKDVADEPQANSLGASDAEIIIRAAINHAAKTTGKAEGDEFEEAANKFAGKELQKAGLTGPIESPMGLLGSFVSGLEAIWKPVDDVLGVAGQYAGTAIGNYSAWVQRNVLRQDEPVEAGPLRIGGEKRKLPSVREAWENAQNHSAGQNYAAATGAKPGSSEYKLASGTADFVARWVFDPTVLAGKAVKGARLAARVPEGALAERSIITRGVYRALSKDPESLLKSRKAQAGVDALWDYASKGEHVVAIADRFRLPYAKALEVANAKSRAEVEGVIRSGLRGEAFVSTAQVEGRLSQLAREASEATGEAAARIRAEVRELEELLTQGPARKRLLTRIPEDTQLGAYRQAIKRGIGKTPLATMANKVLGNSWSQGPFRYFPGRSISMVDTELGAQNFERLGQALKLPRKELDDLLATYRGSTGREQAVQAYFDLLKAGADKLNRVAPGLGDELTKVMDHVSNKGGFIGVDGKRKWARVHVDERGRETPFGQPHLDNEIANELPIPNIEPIRNALSLGGKWRAAMDRAVAGAPKIEREMAALTDELASATGTRAKRIQDELKILEEARSIALNKRLINRVPGGGTIRAALFAPERAGPISSVTSFLTSVVWKPLVLLRVGWSVKQIAEADLRMAALGLNSVYTHPFALVDDARQFAKLATKEDADIALQQQLIEREIYRRDKSGGILTPKDKGHHLAWQDEILTLRSSSVMKYYIEHGAEATKEWLLTGEGKRHWKDISPIAKGVTRPPDFRSSGLAKVGAKDQADVIEVLPPVKAGESAGIINLSDADYYVRTLEERLANAAPTAELRNAVRTGKHGETLVTSRSFADELKRISERTPDIAPHVQNTVSVERLHDPVMFREVIAEAFNVLGSKPYDYFVNKPAWVGFYKKRYEEILSRLPKDADTAGVLSTARAEARAFANQQTVHFLHDLGERSAFHRQVRNIAPFMPAYQKTLEQWLVNIPSQYGLPLGWAYEVARAQTIFDAGKALGMVRKDSRGQWEVSIPGLTPLLQDVLGIEGTIKSSTIFSWFTDFPFTGPALTVLGTETGIIEDLYEKNPSLRTFFDYAFQYGPADSVGARWMGYGLRAMGLPDWAEGLAGLSPKSLDHTEYMMYAEELRLAYDDVKALSDQKIKYAEQEALITDPEAREAFREKWTEEVRQKTQALMADAHRRAKHKLGIRAITGFLSPFSISFKPMGQRKKDEFFKALENLSPDGKRSARAALIAEDPAMELYLLGTSYKTDVEAEKEVAIADEFSRWVRNNRKDYTDEQLTEIAMGSISDSALRREKQRKLEAIGLAGDWAANPWMVEQILDDYALQRSVLEAVSPEWAKARKRSIAAMRAKDGSPLLGFAEDRFLEGMRAFRDLETIFEKNDDGTVKIEDDIDWKGYRRFLAGLRDQMNLDQYFSYEPTGPEKDFAAYWRDHVGPYMDQMSEIFDRTEFASPEARAIAFDDLRNLIAEQEAPTINGQQFPKPEQFLYERKSPQDRAQLRVKWAQGSPEFLSSFQRETLGFESSPESSRYWDNVAHATRLVAEIIRDDRLSGSSKEATNLKDWLKDFKVEEAKLLGVSEDEYLLSEAKPYVRIVWLEQSASIEWDAIGPEWERIKDGADAMWEVLTANELRGATSKLALHLKGNLYPWLDGLREASSRLDTELKYLQSLTVGRRKSLDVFYDYLFFGRLPVGLDPD